MGLTQEQLQKVDNLIEMRKKKKLPTFRTFVNIRDEHRKFWKIARQGDDLLIEYGKIGTDGARYNIYDCKDPYEQMYRRVSAKFDDGYIELHD